MKSETISMCKISGVSLSKLLYSYKFQLTFLWRLPAKAKNNFPTEINKKLSTVATIKKFLQCSVDWNKWGIQGFYLGDPGPVVQGEEGSPAIISKCIILDLSTFTWTPSCLQLQCVSCASTPQRSVSFLLISSCPPLHSPPKRSSCPFSPPLMT